MGHYTHPLDAYEFENLLTEYRMSTDHRGALAACDEMRRVQRKIKEYVEKHYILRTRLLGALETLASRVNIKIGDGGT